MERYGVISVTAVALNIFHLVILFNLVWWLVHTRPVDTPVARKLRLSIDFGPNFVSVLVFASNYTALETFMLDCLHYYGFTSYLAIFAICLPHTSAQFDSVMDPKFCSTSEYNCGFSWKSGTFFIFAFDFSFSLPSLVHCLFLLSFLFWFNRLDCKMLSYCYSQMKCSWHLYIPVRSSCYWASSCFFPISHLALKVSGWSLGTQSSMLQWSASVLFF